MQHLIQVLRQTMITGFSFEFCQRLLERLKQMLEDNKVFTNDARKDLTAGAVPVVYYLAEQMRFNSEFWRERLGEEGYGATRGEITDLIVVAESFIATFDEKPTSPSATKKAKPAAGRDEFVQRSIQAGMNPH